MSLIEYAEQDLPVCIDASRVISACAKNYGGKFHIRLICEGGSTTTLSFESKDDRRDVFTRIVKEMKE